MTDTPKVKASESAPIGISVVVATLNRQQTLAKTLTSLSEQDHSDYEVVVIDQTPSIDPVLAKVLRDHSSKLRFLQLESRGVSYARNKGIGIANGEVILFIDDDVEVGRSFVADHARAHAEVVTGAVAGITVDGRGGAVREALDILPIVSKGSSKIFPDPFIEITWAGSGNLSVRKSILTEIGGFDEKLPGNYAEDVDLTLRIRSAGYSLIADPRIVMVHLAEKRGGGEFRNERQLDQRARERYRCATYCFLKNWRWIGVWQTCGALWRSYRGYAFNRKSILDWSFLRKHVVAVSDLVRVLGQLLVLISDRRSSHSA